MRWNSPKEWFEPTERRLEKRLGRRPTAEEVAEERARLHAKLRAHHQECGLVELPDGTWAARQTRGLDLVEAGVPPTQVSWTLDSWLRAASPRNHHAVRAVRFALERAPWERETLWVWAAGGKPGLGRTGLAVASVAEAVKLGLRAALNRYPELGLDFVAWDDADRGLDWWRLAEGAATFGCTLLLTATQSWDLLEGLGLEGVAVLDKLQPIHEVKLTGSSIRTKKK